MQDDIQRLIPRNIFQPQSQVACHAVADDHIQLGKVRNYIQCFTHGNILKIKRQLFPGIARLTALDQLVWIFHKRLHFDDEFIVGLIGGMLPHSFGFNHHTDIVTLRKGIHRLHRRCKVDHIQLALQILRQIDFKEVNNQFAALTVDIDAHPGIGKINLNAAFAIFTATKIHIIQGMLLHSLAGIGKARNRLNLRRSLGMQGNQHVIPIDTGIVGQHMVEIDDQPCACAGLDNIGTAQITDGKLLRSFAQAICRIWKVQSNTGRHVDGKSGWHTRQRLRQLHLDHGRTRTRFAHAQCGNFVLRFGLNLNHTENHQQAQQSKRAFNQRIPSKVTA